MSHANARVRGGVWTFPINVFVETLGRLDKEFLSWYINNLRLYKGDFLLFSDLPRQSHNRLMYVEHHIFTF